MQKPILAVTSNSATANAVHFTAILVAILCLILTTYGLLPLFESLILSHNWGGVCYLVIVFILIASYWPSLSYRLLITLSLPLRSLLNVRNFSINNRFELPPVSIIVATRNEPASIVIRLLDSLIKLEYHDYEIVLSDNSDIIFSDGTLNNDFIEIFHYVSKNNIRLCRRDCGHIVNEDIYRLHIELFDYRVKGNTEGGKAENLNVAIDSSDDRFRWFLILDADSALPKESLYQLLTIGVYGCTPRRSVGFVQSTLLARNANQSNLSSALSLMDELYYKWYFKVKASLGAVSNYGHGVLVARNAWESTNGFPLEISEDLAWANELALTGSFINYYAECHTLEDKPHDWKALRVQRDRWAKGTTLLLKKQLKRIWRTRNLQYSEKMDLTYDMMSYSFNAIGCVIPILFFVSGILEQHAVSLFKTLIPIFYFSLLIDNVLLPFHAAQTALNRDLKKAWDIVKCIPKVSIYMGGIASQVFVSVSKAIVAKQYIFQVTPKIAKHKQKCYLQIINENRMCYLLFIVNGWVAISALDFYPPIVPLLAISPICYFLAPILGDDKKREGSSKFEQLIFRLTCASNGHAKGARR